MKYFVKGTLEINFGVEVEADSADEAEELATQDALDGRGWDMPTGSIDVHAIEGQGAGEQKADAT